MVGGGERIPALLTIHQAQPLLWEAHFRSHPFTQAAEKRQRGPVPSEKDPWYIREGFEAEFRARVKAFAEGKWVGLMRT